MPLSRQDQRKLERESMAAVRPQLSEDEEEERLLVAAEGNDETQDDDDDRDVFEEEGGACSGAPPESKMLRNQLEKITEDLETTRLNLERTETTLAKHIAESGKQFKIDEKQLKNYEEQLKKHNQRAKELGETLNRLSIQDSLDDHNDLLFAEIGSVIECARDRIAFFVHKKDPSMPQSWSSLLFEAEDRYSDVQNAINAAAKELFDFSPQEWLCLSRDFYDMCRKAFHQTNTPKEKILAIMLENLPDEFTKSRALVEKLVNGVYARGSATVGLY